MATVLANRASENIRSTKPVSKADAEYNDDYDAFIIFTPITIL